MIDHILVTDEVLPLWFNGTERVENTKYVGSYLSTTSDHYPVWVRLRFTEGTALAPTAAATSLSLDTPYPTPARGAVTTAFHLPAPSAARLEVFDLLGRRLMTIFAGPAGAGTTPVTFSTDALPAGVYLLRLSADGHVATQTFVRM